VGQENIRPKSIAREMFEEFRSFADYIKLYELHRSEGLLLRHLNSVYKVLAADGARPDEAALDITRDIPSFTAAVRAKVFAFLRALSHGEFEEALALMSATTAEVEMSQAQAEAAVNWTPLQLGEQWKRYLGGHASLRLDPEARNARHTRVVVDDDKKGWRVEQVMVDPDGLNDWQVEFRVDLRASRQRREPVMGLLGIRALI
jgi:hypothetical protein